MKLKYAFYGLIFLFLTSLVFLAPKGAEKSDSIKKSETIHIKDVGAVGSSQETELMDLSDLNIKPMAEDFVPPESLDKNVLDLINDTKRNQEELLRLDQMINEKINFILKTKKLNKNEKNKINYLSEDGNLKLTIAYSDEDQIRFIAYEDIEKSLRYISSKNYFGKEKDILKKELLHFI